MTASSCAIVFVPGARSAAVHRSAVYGDKRERPAGRALELSGTTERGSSWLQLGDDCLELLGLAAEARDLRALLLHQFGRRTAGELLVLELALRALDLSAGRLQVLLEARLEPVRIQPE